MTQKQATIGEDLFCDIRWRESEWRQRGCYDFKQAKHNRAAENLIAYWNFCYD